MTDRATTAISARRAAPHDPRSRWQVVVRETGAGQPLCLALANTRNWRHAAAPVERLESFGDLASFARSQRILADSAAARLMAHAQRHSRAAQAELVATIALREAIFRTFCARAAVTSSPDGDRALITGTFNAAVAGLALDLRDGTLVPRERVAQRLDAVRLQCAVSAVALLTSPHVDKVKMCADDRGCGWLFLDLTRNSSRRFCFSNECGNRARQAAFRARHRHDAAAPAAR
jgi:predicted RNA-binding Zn ribbon-like protein